MSIVGSDYTKTETGAFDVFFGDLMQFTILKYRIKIYIAFRGQKKQYSVKVSSKVLTILKGILKGL